MPRAGYAFHVVEDAAGRRPEMSKYRVFDLYPEVDRFLVVDADTMVRWDCPDPFELVGDRFGIAHDLGNVGWIVEAIRAHQPFFPDVRVDWWDYFNAGVLVMSRHHRPLARRMLDWADAHPAPISHGARRASVDQTVLNFLLRELDVPLHVLPLPFNLTMIAQRGLLPGNRFLEAGYVWHFNGLDKERAMTHTWNLVRQHYTSGAE